MVTTGAGSAVGPDGWEATVRLARALRRLAAATAGVVLVTGCGLGHLQNLSFRVDHRLHFLAPKDRADVRTPFTVRWRMSDFTVEAPGSAPPSRHAGYFVLFVDRQPIQPAHSLHDICKADIFERDDRNCPTVSYLNTRGIYPTTSDHVTLTQIADIANDRDKLQLHTFVVILVDTSGHRIGESAWELDLRLPRHVA